MKLLTLWITAVVLPLSSIHFATGQTSPSPNTKGALKWAEDFDAALKEGEKSKKPVALFFTTDWHSMAKKMEAETFADPSVKPLLAQCVLVRMNPEGSDKIRELTEQYNVSGPPAFILANYKGESVVHREGYQTAENFSKFLKSALAAFKKNGALGYESVKLDKNDLLMTTIPQMPKRDTIPTRFAAIQLVDQYVGTLTADGVATVMIRQSHYSLDPDRGPIAQVNMRYNSSREKAKLKAVRILDKNGVGRVVDVSLAEDEPLYSNENIYWEVRNIHLDLPPLKAGQILDWIEEREMRPVMPKQFALHWGVAGTIFVRSDLALTFPEKLGLQQHAVRCTTPVTESKGRDGTVTWKLVTQNLEVPDPEMFAPDYAEDWKGYVFTTDTSWNSVAQWFSELCKGRDRLPTDAAKKVAELKKAHTNQTELLQAIFDWVTKDVRYVGILFGQSSHQPHAVAETLKTGYGDCKDQSLLLHTLCKEAGIPSDLVLVRAGYGLKFDAPQPGIHHFNHCIIEARPEGKPVYLDPSAGRGPVGWLPYADCSTQAMRVSNGKGEIITLPPYQPYQDANVHKTIIKINPNGSAVVTQIDSLRGPMAYATKMRMRDTSVAKMRKFLEDGFKRSGQKLLDLSMTNPKEEGDSYEAKMTITVPRFAARSNEGYVFRLASDEDGGDNWLAAMEAPRVRGFRFKPSDVELRVYEVEMPEGAILKSKPDDVEISNEFMRASRKVVVKDGKFVVTESTMTLDATLPPSKSAEVLQTFRKFQDSRQHAFILAFPPAEPKGDK